MTLMVSLAPQMKGVCVRERNICPENPHQLSSQKLSVMKSVFVASIETRAEIESLSLRLGG